MTPPVVTAGQTMTTERLVAIAREKAGGYELGADPVVDALWDALDALEEEREAWHRAQDELAEAQDDARGHLADLSKIADAVLDLERGIMTMSELVAFVRRTR